MLTSACSKVLAYVPQLSMTTSTNNHITVSAPKHTSLHPTHLQPQHKSTQAKRINESTPPIKHLPQYHNLQSLSSNPIPPQHPQTQHQPQHTATKQPINQTTPITLITVTHKPRLIIQPNTSPFPQKPPQASFPPLKPKIHRRNAPSPMQLPAHTNRLRITHEVFRAVLREFQV